MFSFTQLLAAVAFTSPALVDAFWRMECGTMQTGRIDPIVSPGTVSSHVHKISGGSNINVNSTYDSMRESACTSCEIGADKSGYWTPQLYFEHANGTFEEVPNGGHVVYYLGRGADIDNAVPFPPGFKMLSGTPLARSYDNETMTWGNSTYPPRPVSDRVSFVCIPDYSKPALPQLTSMDFDSWGGNQVCENGMRAQIQFQSCWDGVNLYKDDNSHVAYLSQIDNGACPPTHPVQFIHLFFEVYYTVAMPQFDMTSGGRFVFAYGDPTGFGFHGDFLNGWDIDVLGTAIDECAVGNQFGTIDTCAPLAASDTNTYGQNCPQYAPFGVPLIDEKVTGVIGDSLPGCITIVDGPEPATFADIECGPNVPNPTIESFPEQTPIIHAQPVEGQSFGLNGWAYVDCFQDGVNYTRTLSGDSTQSPNMTIEYCQNYCFSNGWRFAGVEYGTQCFCDSQISAAALNNQTGCTQQCAGNSTELCGGANMISIFNNSMSTATIAAPGAGATPLSAGIYVGCASEGTNGRALSGASTRGANMTLESCRSYCTAQGFVYSGTEYSDECYCGNSFSNGGALLASNSSCNMLCAGDNMETCGGPNRLSVFSIPVNAAATCPMSNGTTMTIGTSQYTLSCNTNLAGGDLGMNYTDSVYDCASACANTANCVASTWVPGSPAGACYMKGSVGTASTSSTAWSVIAKAVVHTCPSFNGAIVTGGNASYILQCSTDHPSGDLTSVSANTVDACAAACANTTSCVGASFVPGYPGSCYMKSKLTAGVNNGNVWALVPASSVATSSTSSSSSSTSSLLTSTSSSSSTTSILMTTSSITSSSISTSSASTSSASTSSVSTSSASTSSASTSSASTSSTSSTPLTTSTSSSATANGRTAATADGAAQANRVPISLSSSTTSSSTSSSSASSSSSISSAKSSSSFSTSTSSSIATSSTSLKTSSSVSTSSSSLTTSSIATSSTSLKTSSAASTSSTSLTTSSVATTSSTSLKTSSSAATSTTSLRTSSSALISSTTFKTISSSSALTSSSSTIKTTSSSTTSSTSSTSATPTIQCPASNMTSYSVFNSTTNVNSTFQVQCGLDHGGNAGMLYVNTLEACMTACANFANCTDVSWVAAKPGPCYLKTKLQPAGKVNTAVWGAVVLSQTTVAAQGAAPTARPTALGKRGFMRFERS